VAVKKGRTASPVTTFRVVVVIVVVVVLVVEPESEVIVEVVETEAVDWPKKVLVV
jgi:hypothetical protein